VLEIKASCKILNLEYTYNIESMLMKVMHRSGSSTYYIMQLLLYR